MCQGGLSAPNPLSPNPLLHVYKIYTKIAFMCLRILYIVYLYNLSN